MVSRSPYFSLTLLLVTVQQVTLAVSTYHIALAGKSLANSLYPQVQYHMISFFIFALGAYFISSLSTFSQIRLKNNLWRSYVINIFKELNNNQNLSSKENKQKTISWLTGEASFVFDEVSHFSAEIVSVYCNVIFTLIVFNLALGLKITTIIASSLLISAFLVSFLKNKIHYLADNIQQSKLTAFIKIPSLWDNCLFGNSKLTGSALKSFESSSNQYFKQTEKYTFLEQCIACLPIYITVPLIIYIIAFEQPSYLLLGAFVAVLPRSLQLLGNVHSLSIYNSRFILIKRKLKNLKDFYQELSKQNLTDQINSNKVEIYNVNDHATELSFSDLVENILKKRFIAGRFLITGKNGSGKTSLLKLIKASFPEAIFLSPEAMPGEFNFTGSTGEQQVNKIKEIFSEHSEIYLLDEWDANLDFHNQQEIDAIINSIKEKTIVIEVRHNKTQPY